MWQCPTGRNAITHTHAHAHTQKFSKVSSIVMLYTTSSSQPSFEKFWSSYTWQRRTNTISNQKNLLLKFRVSNNPTSDFCTILLVRSRISQGRKNLLNCNGCLWNFTSAYPIMGNFTSVSGCGSRVSASTRLRTLAHAWAHKGERARTCTRSSLLRSARNSPGELLVYINKKKNPATLELT